MMLKPVQAYNTLINIGNEESPEINNPGLDDIVQTASLLKKLIIENVQDRVGKKGELSDSVDV